MNMVLKRLGRLAAQSAPSEEPAPGMVQLEVRYCGVCRTDAKMWREGHRDLVLPRVLGHEVVARDTAGQPYAVWPGAACGACVLCTSGRENLCPSMRIMGFHFDGGFSGAVTVPAESLIPLPGPVREHLVCFAEPLGCVLNMLSRLDIPAGGRLAIYGGGTMGLLTALVAAGRDIRPLVIERSAAKQAKARPFLDKTGIECLRDSTDSGFDAAVNACPDPGAFSQSISRLAAGGRFGFFSGLRKNEGIDTNLLNLIHYREAVLAGSYGLTREHMRQALPLIERHADHLELLVEATVPLRELPLILPRVLDGSCLKFLVDCSDGGVDPLPPTAAPHPAHVRSALHRRLTGSAALSAVCARVKPVSAGLLPAAQHKIDHKIKPPGSLGRLESLAVQMCQIQNTLHPSAGCKAMLVFAADHGIAEEGISAFPVEVTTQMVNTFLHGGAAINVLCRHHGIDLRVTDIGVKGDPEPHPELMRRKVRRGTRNFAQEAAMTRSEAICALETGMEAFFELHARHAPRIIGLGEMGIGNTTAAAAIICAATGIAPSEAAGRGSGIDDAAMERKIQLLDKALALHRPSPDNGLDILEKVGGYEIAGMAGAALAAASSGVAVVLDGVISSAAGLIASLIQPEVAGYLISGHRSVEISQKTALERLRLSPVLDLEMRLGEGTGAALTMNIVEAACKILCEMASFDESGVTRKQG